MFAMVRNPWARTLSAFNFAKQGQTDSMGVTHPEQYRVPEFDTFERFLRDWLAPRQLSNLDFIFRPQMEFISDPDGEILVDFWGRLENLDDALGQVGERIGRQIEVTRENVTSHTSTAASSYRSSYTQPWMIDLVREKYSQDIHNLNYEY